MAENVRRLRKFKSCFETHVLLWCVNRVGNFVARDLNKVQDTDRLCLLQLECVNANDKLEKMKMSTRELETGQANVRDYQQHIKKNAEAAILCDTHLKHVMYFLYWRKVKQTYQGKEVCVAILQASPVSLKIWVRHGWSIITDLGSQHVKLALHVKNT